MALIYSLLLLSLTLGTWSHPLNPLDNVDSCLYSCTYCYQDLVALACANNCLKTNGNPGVEWVTQCPQLNMPLYFNYELKNK